MSKSGSGAAGLAFLLILGGLVLASDPKCNCGCRTLAEHLIKAGIGLASKFPS